MSMRTLFESFRRYSTLSPHQLLIEGRKQDAAKKYPELAKKHANLDGESLLDTLIAADPSGNQKYLMGAARMLARSMENAEKENDYVPFWGKVWPQDAADNLYSPWGVARNIGNELQKFHKLQQLIPPEKRDVNTIATYSQLQDVIRAATQKQEEKERKKQAQEREKATAKEESYVVADNDQYTMIRPTTTHASCYYGKGTKWCISATQANNYFDEYTSEGKSFYFVFFPNISNNNPFKKIALVVDMNGYFDEAFDAEDNNLYPHEIQDAILQNLLHEKEDGGALEVYRYYDNEKFVDEPSEKDIADYVKRVKELRAEGDALEQCIGRPCFEPAAEQANHNLRVIAQRLLQDMKDEAEGSHEEDPPGPTPEQFEELKDAYEQEAQHISVDLQFPYDTGASQTYWDSRAWVDVEEVMMDHPLVREKRLKWRVDIENLTEEQQDEIREAVDAALNYVNIWPDDMYNEMGLEFSIQIDTGGGSLGDLDSFLDNTLYQDGQWTEGFVEGLLEALEERKLIGRDKREEEYWPDPEEKEKQLELPLQESRGIKLIIRRK